jgi:hypothetical protein
MKINVIFFLCVSFAMQAQIGARVQQQGKIHGLWQNSEFGYDMTLILNQDGSGEFDGEAIRFTEKGNVLAIISGDKTTSYTYNLKGDALTLSGGDLDKPITFSRKGKETSTQAAGSQPSDAAFSATDKKLMGLWSGNGEMIEFKADGNCVYMGNNIPYKISQGHIILATAQGNATIPYAIVGSVLNLTVNGQKMTYTKPPGQGAVGNTPAATSGGNIPMELVGQWCYMNMTSNSQTSRCINLRADGTYTYSYEGSRSVNTETLSGGTASQSGDRGTWYVQGDRIYYNSQSAGQGSYRLEKRNHPKNVNDPMIVLDGEPFVTTTARSPWR